MRPLAAHEVRHNFRKMRDVVVEGSQIDEEDGSATPGARRGATSKRSAAPRRRSSRGSRRSPAGSPRSSR